MNTEELKTLVVTLLEDMKAMDIVSLDVSQLTSITDEMIICSGNSERHVKAIARNLLDQVKSHDIRPLGIEGEKDSDWILVDLGDVLVHIMQPKARTFYELEKLWTVPVSK